VRYKVLNSGYGVLDPRAWGRGAGLYCTVAHLNGPVLCEFTSMPLVQNHLRLQQEHDCIATPILPPTHFPRTPLPEVYGLFSGLEGLERCLNPFETGPPLWVLVRV